MKNILLLLAHADDECLGCGGYVQKLVADGHQVRLVVVSDGVVAMRKTGSTDSDDVDNRSALAVACGILGIADFMQLGFKDQQFEQYPIAEIANAAHQAANNPDLIITHSEKDLNNDHRIVNMVAKIVGRPRTKPISVLTCEIPSVATWNGTPFQPNFYVNIAKEIAGKIAAFAAYTHENKTFPDPFSAEGLRVLAQMRGMESGYAFAEAFEVLRWNA